MFGELLAYGYRRMAGDRPAAACHSGRNRSRPRHADAGYAAHDRQARAGSCARSRRRHGRDKPTACRSAEGDARGTGKSGRLACDHRQPARTAADPHRQRTVRRTADPPVCQDRRPMAGSAQLGSTRQVSMRFVAGPGAPDPLLAAQDAAAAPDGRGRRARACPHGADGSDCRCGSPAMAVPPLLIDYGHLRSASATRCRQYRAHRYEGVLDSPGEADLTAHVDFAQLAACAERHALPHASVDARRLPARHGPARARRRAWRREPTPPCAKRTGARSSVLPGAAAMGELVQGPADRSRPGFACHPSRWSGQFRATSR